MNDKENIEIGSIRKTVLKLINKVIKSEDLKKKEINCFDSLVSRRHFLSGSAKFAGLGALACSGVVPSAWGRLNSDYSSNPADFGITQAEMAQEAAAYQFKFGTELFTQVVQDKPYSASHSTQGKHVALESFNGGQLKIQAIVDQTEPTEYGFNDYDSNFGTTEMAHLAEMEGGWGIEILEKKIASLGSDESSGGYDTTKISPYKFATRLTGKETLYRLHHPPHNTLDSSGKKMLGVQAFFIAGITNESSYLCIRWLEAEAAAAISDKTNSSNRFSWQIIPFNQLGGAGASSYLGIVRTYTDINGKDFITIEHNEGSTSLNCPKIICIGGWKDIRYYTLNTQFKKMPKPKGQDPRVNLANIVQMKSGSDPSNDTFWTSLRGCLFYTSRE